MALERLRSDFEWRIKEDRRPPLPAGIFWVGYHLFIPVVAVRPGSFLETVFQFSVIVLPTVPVIASGSGPPGRVWEGATAPLPIERDVSEANSFLRGVWGESPNVKVIHKSPCVLLKQVLKEC